VEQADDGPIEPPLPAAPPDAGDPPLPAEPPDGVEPAVPAAPPEGAALPAAPPVDGEAESLLPQPESTTRDVAPTPSSAAIVRCPMGTSLAPYLTAKSRPGTRLARSWSWGCIGGPVLLRLPQYWGGRCRVFATVTPGQRRPFSRSFRRWSLQARRAARAGHTNPARRWGRTGTAPGSNPRRCPTDRRPS
jgi:hypothetical protein